MRDENFEVCLLTSPVCEVIDDLGLRLRPLRALHHQMVDAVEANYCLEADALLLRLRFSKDIRDVAMQQKLVRLLGDLGLQLILPQNLSPFEREKFDALLREHYRLSIQRFPTAHTPSVVPELLDALQAHLAGDQASASPMESREQRALTVDAHDLVIAELARPESQVDLSSWPLRAETFGPLDEMIENLSSRSSTVDALDDFIDELRR